MNVPDDILNEARCVSTSIPDHEQMTPNGISEDCWKTWNPYADFTRVFEHLLYQWKLSPKVFDIMFPDYSLKTDVVSLLGDFRKNLFGRPSIDDINKTVDHEVLKRTTPKMLFKRFSEQFVDSRGEFSLMRVSAEVPYPSFSL